jgi:penicillin-binding protein 2
MYMQRLKIFLALVAAIFVIMVGRLVHLQIARGERYRQQAELLLQSYEFPEAQRGRIVDRNGIVLATDEACFDFCMDYAFLVGDADWKARQLKVLADQQGLDLNDDAQRRTVEAMFTHRVDATWDLAHRIANELGQDLSAARQGVIRKIRRWAHAVGRDVREQYMAHPVIRGLDETYANSLRPLLGETLGASLRPSHRRCYPHKQLACHLVGVVGPVYREEEQQYNLTADEADWPSRMQTNYLPGDRIGKIGIEKMCEALLRPQRGVRRYRRPGVIAEEKPPCNGLDIQLTIDLRLQERLTRLLRDSGHNGAIVVIDVASGEVLAAVSWPVYDLQTFWADYGELAGLQRVPAPEGADPSQRQPLTRRSQWALANRPLMNRPLTGRYEPGSTVKPLIAAAGLAAGQITPQTTFNCPGYAHMTPGGQTILRCWRRSGHGSLSMVEAICQSCNVYFPRVADKLGIRGVLFWLEEFGFARRPGTGLPEEVAGTLPTSDWLASHRESMRYYPSDRWFLTVGQGVFTATPMQVANAHATLARGGMFLSPRLARQGSPPQIRRRLPLSESQVRTLHEGMRQVVHEPGGTAYKYWHGEGEVPDVTVCGKTGTAQSNRKGLDHAWFAGFAPFGKPAIAFAVLQEYAGSGGAEAAPLAREVIAICQQYGYLR